MKTLHTPKANGNKETLKRQDNIHVKAQIIPFRKNLNLSSFNVSPIEWRKIRTNDDKKLSSSEIELLWTIHRLAVHHNTNELQLSYAYLGYTCGLGVSQRQLNRYLHKLASAKIIKFHTEKSAVNYDKKLIIKIDFEILENLMTVRFDRQVCQSNMSGYNIDKNKLKNKEIEDSSYRAISSISKKERNKNKKEKTPKQSNDLPCHPDGAASHSDCSTEKQNEETMKAYDWEDPARKLDLAISKNFDTQMATTLTTDVDYLHIPQRNTLQLVLKKKLAISEQDQNRLKQLIKGIYGNDIKTALVLFYAKKADVVKIPQAQEKLTSNPIEPANTNLCNASQVYRKIISNLELAHGPERIKAWFGNVKFIETEKSIVFDTSDSAVDYITNNFTSALKQSSKELGMSLRFIGRSKVQVGTMYNVEITEDGKYNINHQLAE